MVLTPINGCKILKIATLGRTFSTGEYSPWSGSRHSQVIAINQNPKKTLTFATAFELQPDYLPKINAYSY